MTEPQNSLLVLFAGERGFKCARAARSLVYVLCFMFGLAVGAGSLEFAGRVLLCAFALLFFFSERVSVFAFSCFVLFCVSHSLCFSLAGCFHVCHVLFEHAAYESPY